MKSKTLKKFSAIFLSAIMVLTMMPAMAFAEIEKVEEDVTTEYVPAVNYDEVALFDDAKPTMPMRMMTFSARSVTPDNGLTLSKSATDNGDGTYKISLEAYTTGTVTSSQETKPCDIVLVLDQSTSMEDSFSSSSKEYSAVYSLNENESYYINSGSGYKEVEWCDTCNAWTDGCGWFIGHIAGTEYTPKDSATDSTAGRVQFYKATTIAAMDRLEALQQAATAFVDQVSSQEGEHRIAIVGFHDTTNYLTGTGSSALWDAETRASDLKTVINNLGNDLEPATDHDDGLNGAIEIFKATDSTDRQRVVVMLTDGEPEPMNSGSWSENTVKNTIEAAYTLKTTYSAALYCVSVMPGTNATNPTSNMDKYMDYTSSNYPNARYTGNTSNSTNSNTIIGRITPGSKIDTTNGSFYLTASDISTLESIFEQIANQTGSATIQLGTETVVKDIVSDYFTLPNGADSSQITVSTKDAYFENGELKWKDSTLSGTQPTASVSGKDVNVTGFDFNRNFVAETGRVEGDVTQAGNFHGRKLIIEFNVTPTEDFLGGNGVPTNGNASGVYDSEGNVVENFEQPTVNVPVKTITPDVQDQYIYYTNSTDLDKLVKSFDSRLDGTNNDYAKVTYTIKDGETVVGTYIVEKGATSGNWSDINDTALSNDKTYTVVCTVDGTNDGSENVSNGTNDATVYVFKPVITFEDSVVYYGETVDLDDNFDSIVWKNSALNKEAKDVSMTGNEPDVTLTYEYTEDAISNSIVVTKNDISVNVVPKIGEKDISDMTTFKHESCSIENCLFDPTNEEFILHVKTCTLTITKKGGTEGEPYIFNIKKDGADYTSVTIVGNGEVTLEELPVGTYVVTEDESWSWRYNPSMSDGTAVLSAADPEEIATCTNTKDKPFWLDDFTSVITNVFKVEKVEEGGTANE